MGIWQDSAAEVSAAIDEAFGETVILRPQVTRPNYPQSPDPARPVATMLATFVNQSMVANQQGKSGVRFEPLTQTRNPQFTFNRFVLGYSIQRGDMIERSCDGTLWEVTAVKPDGFSRIVIDVVQLGRSEQ